MDLMTCSICGRTSEHVCDMENHHLVPQRKGPKDTITVCVDCGNQIHMLFSNRDLRYTYNTLESLLANERVHKWVQWVRKRPGFGVCAKAKKKR